MGAAVGEVDREERPERWALRREYRSTFRSEMVGTEQLLAGRWFTADDEGLPEVSMEREVAEDLGLQLGDTLTWDVQGVQVATRVTSLLPYVTYVGSQNFISVPFDRFSNYVHWEPDVDTTSVTEAGRLVCATVRNWAQDSRSAFLVVGYE